MTGLSASIRLETSLPQSTASETSVQVERWADCLPEMEEIFPLHWKELARFQDKIALKCDTEKYAALEKSDILLLVTARAEGRLVGYFVGFIMPHPHYRDAGLFGL